MPSGVQPTLRSKSHKLPLLLVILGVCGVLVGIGVIKHRINYPYGWSHCCIIQLSQALWMYAGDHGGRYPTGEKTAEACLSLLYKVKYPGGQEYATPNLLRGMTVP